MILYYQKVLSELLDKMMVTGETTCGSFENNDEIEEDILNCYCRNSMDPSNHFSLHEDASNRCTIDDKGQEKIVHSGHEDMPTTTYTIAQSWLIDNTVKPPSHWSGYPIPTVLENNNSIVSDAGRKNENEINDQNSSTSKISHAKYVSSTMKIHLPIIFKGFFPKRLHCIIDYLSNNAPQIASWNYHGRSFKIRQKHIFIEKIAPQCFSMSQSRSFNTQLKRYGFQLITGSGNKDKDYIYHKLFLRGNSELCTQIKTLKKVNLFVMKSMNQI